MWSDLKQRAWGFMELSTKTISAGAGPGSKPVSALQFSKWVYHRFMEAAPTVTKGTEPFLKLLLEIDRDAPKLLPVA